MAVANAGRGLDHAVEHDGETMADVRLGDLAEFLRAFAVEFQLHRPALVAVVGVRFRHAIAAEVGFLLHQQPLFHRLLVRRLRSILYVSIRYSGGITSVPASIARSRSPLSG